ncbi:MAG: cupin domain-containing protein [Gemmatimonadota bacterium]|nr:cupin domain-containing protein [Gemmatimonadota bacterium]
MRKTTFAGIAASATLVGSLYAMQLQPPAAIAKQILTQTLPDLQGKEVSIVTVEYPPGAVSAPHRHDSDTFVYVLEGSIVMQVAGGKQVTLHPGDTFYESPTDVHSVGKNASSTERAKFLVFFIKNQGAPASRPPI